MSQEEDFDWEEQLSVLFMRAAQGARVKSEAPRGVKRAQDFEADWRNDPRFTLPAGKIEPYNLWFGFLKAALKDPDVQVTRDTYEAWGPVESVSFDEWWPQHWRTIFGVDVGVRAVSKVEAQDLNEGVLFVRLALSQKPKVILQQVSDLLVAQCAFDSREMTQGLFGFDCGTNKEGEPINPKTRFLRNLGKLKMLMGLYAAWVYAPGNTRSEREEHAINFYAGLMDELKRCGAPLAEVPDAVNGLRRSLSERGGRRRVPLYEQSDTRVSNYRRQVLRYLQKAQDIASNVGRGQFPGQY